MNMLIIGNGFDLAHDRPTTYLDFIDFLKHILFARDYDGNRMKFESSLSIDRHSVKEYILSSFDTRRNPGRESAHNINAIIQELYDCLDENSWYEYFKWIIKNNSAHGKNWIDFESEIRNIIEFFDHKIPNIYEVISCSPSSFSDCPTRVKEFWRIFKYNDYDQRMQRGAPKPYTYSDFIAKSYQDLEKLIRCLEIYLDDCVGKMPITWYSPDIKELKCDFVLSFNYTVIPTDIYPSLAHTHNIHGHAKAGRPAAENDMVLGVNEYWEGPEKSVQTNFNLYKKFVQRIIKGTGIDYKTTLNQMASDYEEGKRFQAISKEYFGARHSNVYIFGHSLDVTDGDILKEVIQTPGVITTIFYRNKQQQANQIANLSKVLGQDKLLECTFSAFPTIIFKQQAKMETI